MRETGPLVAPRAGRVLAGRVTALPLWIPAGVVIGAAAVLLGHPHTTRDCTSVHTA